MTQIIAMARQATAEEILLPHETKAKGLVTNTMKEYEEYKVHLQDFYDARNQLHEPTN